MSEWKEQDHNEVSIIINGEVIAKASGPSSSLDLIRNLVDEMQKRESKEQLLEDQKDANIPTA